MFKLLAIRPLTGCASWIHKCLHIDMMYYFCKDYFINESKTYIKRTRKNIKPLNEDFFFLNPTENVNEDFFFLNPIVNISAVVGMNGDGKSSLIELIMRLVNNCAFDYNLYDEENGLRRVKGVKAELYYLVDNILYRMVEEGNADRVTIWQMADLNDLNLYEWKIKETEMTEINNPASFFFTLVSNYSHYAYNTHDYQHEWEVKGNEENDDEKCWLHYIFHKNDGYKIPITLHPYREEGNIDVNREYDLSRQRLLSLFLNASHPKNNPDSIRRLNHKDAEFLALTELSYSKLQEKSIIEYFRTTQNKTKLDVVLNQIENVENVDNDEIDENSNIEYKKLMDDVLPNKFECPLIEIMAQDDGFMPFVKNVINWLEKKINISNIQSDIRFVRDRLNSLSARYHNKISELQYGRYGNKHGFLLKINAAQLGRLDTIYRILQFLKIDPIIVSKEFKDLTLEEKCNHYKVYKILSIIHTYPQYKKLIGTGDEQNIFKEYDERLEQCIEAISKDSDSHVTRKIQQVENFMKRGLERGGLYERIGKRDENTNRLLIDIDKLKEESSNSEIKLDELPPPIYEWTILFRKEGEETCNIELNSFSSGEKQMLYSLCSVIYHLLNLENTSTTVYPNINLILEEIELYYHPECQRNIIKRMLELIRGAKLNNIKNINIIFVTHSPFILSDVPKCNVIFLQNGMEKDTMQENTFGANIHSLLKNGFFLPNLTMGEFAYLKINSLFDKLNSGNFNREMDLEDIYQQILLVGEPFLRNQLLYLYNAYKGNFIK